MLDMQTAIYLALHTAFNLSEPQLITQGGCASMRCAAASHLNRISKIHMWLQSEYRL
jgi:hypothetical protein